MNMNALKHIVRFPMMLALCTLIVACTQPTSDAGGLQDEFEVALGFPRDKAATGRSTINDDAFVEKVYVKVYNSSNVHLPAIDAMSDISGVTKLSYDSVGGKWSATVKLATPASGTITFELWAVTSWGMTLYAGEVSHVVGVTNNSITIATQTVDPIGSPGPSGGLIFYSKGSYSDGWRFLEAAPSDIMLGAPYYEYFFGYYRNSYGMTRPVGGTATSIGSGKANTVALVSKMGSAAFTSSIGSTTTTTAEYAARLCDIHEAGGYGDWFLPSQEELNLMYQNLKTKMLGGFTGYIYWSSSESDSDGYYAWRQDFTYGTQSSSGRFNKSRVRPIRAF